MKCATRECNFYDESWFRNCRRLSGDIEDCVSFSDQILQRKDRPWPTINKAWELQQTTAPKNNEQEGKARMRLIPMDLLREFLLPAYEEGILKYREESWRLGFNTSTMMDALQRHMELFYYHGEDLDPEPLDKFGIEKHHLGAALFCILCMCDTMKNHPELDDRWSKESS